MAARLGGVSTTFDGNSDGFVNAVNRANQSLDNHGKTLRRSRRDMRQFVQNGIYGIEDIASTIGTGGLAGATRAASNNITMMAMAVGGTWGMAAGVAVTTALQLGLAFSGIEDSSKDAEEKIKAQEEALNAYNKRLDESIALAEKQASLQKKLKDGDLEERAKAKESLAEEIKQKEVVARHLQRELAHRRKASDAAAKEARELKPKHVFTAGASLRLAIHDDKHKRKLAQKEYTNKIALLKQTVAAEQKAIEATTERYSKTRREIDKLVALQKWASKETAGDATDKAWEDIKAKEEKAAETRIDNIKKEGEFRQSLAGFTKKQIQEKIDQEEGVLEAIQEQHNAAQDAWITEQKRQEIQAELNARRGESERKIAIAKEAQAKAAEEQKKHIKDINSELNNSIKGSKEFAKAFQNVVKKDILPADLDMSVPKARPKARGYSNPLRRGLSSGQSPIDRFMEDNRDGGYVEGMFGSMDTAPEHTLPIDTFLANRKTPEAGKGIDDFLKNRNAGESKRPAPAIEKYFEQKEAKEEAKFKELNKEAKETAKNTKASNELLSSIADSLNNGTRIDVVMGGILS